MGSLKSKKLVIALLAAVGMIVNDLYGKPVSEETIYSVLGLLGTYILGQGLADHGSQGAAKAAERAVGMGVDIAAAVQGALGAPASGKQHIHDDEPAWEDTTEVDEEDDGPKDLNG